MSNHTAEIAEVRRSLERAEGNMADMLAAIRVRMEYALTCLEQGCPEQAAAVLRSDVETLRGGWLGGDVGGNA